MGGPVDGPRRRGIVERVIRKRVCVCPLSIEFFLMASGFVLILGTSLGLTWGRRPAWGCCCCSCCSRFRFAIMDAAKINHIKHIFGDVARDRVRETPGMFLSAGTFRIRSVTLFSTKIMASAARSLLRAVCARLHRCALCTHPALVSSRRCAHPDPSLLHVLQ